jgi:O-antigen ligase
VCLYFLVLINAFSTGRVRTIYLILLLSAVVMSVQGILAYHTGYQKNKLVAEGLSMGFVVIRRIRAYGFLSDPNDLAQFLLVALASLGIFWRKGLGVANVLPLTIPAGILIYAIYLTHSRGAMIGICVIAVVLISSRFGRMQSAVAAGALFLVMVGFKFGAGREISLSEGSAAGRLMAWGSGISMLKQNPLFGVGYGRFTEFNDLTAHNSFVLCFAELGAFGYFFWLALILTTVIGLERLARWCAITAEDESFTRIVTTTRAALYSFLATSLFLSRTYNVTLYVVLALAAALISQREQRHPELALRPGRWIPLTVAGQFASLVLFYIAIRLRSF